MRRLRLGLDERGKRGVRHHGTAEVEQEVDDLGSGDQVTAYYSLDGNVLDLWVDFVNTTVGATPGALLFALPNSLIAAITGYVGTIEYSDNAAAAAMGTAYVVSGNGYVAFLKTGGANWSAASDTTRLHGHVRIPVN